MALVRTGMVSLSTPLDKLTCTSRSGNSGSAQPWWLAALAVLPVVIYYARRSLVRFGLLRRLALVADAHAAVARAGGGAGRTEAEPRDFPAVYRPGGRSKPERGPGCGKIVRPYFNAAAGAGQGGPPGVSALCGRARRSGDGSLRRRGARRPPGTDIAAAITAARATIPADDVPQIVLLSDGNQTAHDALAAARAAGVPVATVPLPGPEHEVYLAAIRAPVQVRAWEPFEVDATVQSTHDDTCTVELRSGPQSLGRQQKFASTRAKTTSAFPCGPQRTGRPWS